MVLISEDTFYSNYQNYIVPCYLYSIGESRTSWARLCFDKMSKPHPVKAKGKAGWQLGRKRVGSGGKALV